MTTLFSNLIDYLEEEKWKYEILEGESIIRFHYKGSAGRLLCYGEVDEKKQWVLFYSYLPVNVPMDKLREASEFICRANQGMRIGNFELDFEDGEVRYKTSLDIEGGDLTSKMIDNLLRANLSTMNRYFSGLMKIIFSDIEVKEAIEGIEGQHIPRPNPLAQDDSDDDDELGIDSELEDLSDMDEFDDDEEEPLDSMNLTGDDLDEGTEPPEPETERKP